jgi:hypothetical protein
MKNSARRGHRFRRAVAMLSWNVEDAGARPHPMLVKTSVDTFGPGLCFTPKRKMLPRTPLCINQKFTIYLRARLPPFKMKQKKCRPCGSDSG